jgi:hypothetical protein
MKPAIKKKKPARKKIVIWTWTERENPDLDSLYGSYKTKKSALNSVRKNTHGEKIHVFKITLERQESYLLEWISM